ncbi:MAG: hypothetical protein JRE40_11685, partial [Deltaproteobacteria bacterium]|nr:hypothetical protein [Deltaproteobacteria bacterium]
MAFAISEEITLQGKLTNSNGQALSGDYTFLFELFDSNSGGTAFWDETHGLTVTNGIFAANLGSNNSTQYLTTSDFNAERWVQITVNGLTQVPRVKLNSQPSAFIAKKAMGIDLNAFMQFSDFNSWYASTFAPSFTGDTNVVNLGVSGTIFGTSPVHIAGGLDLNGSFSVTTETAGSGGSEILGSNLVTNGTFDNGSNWSPTGFWTISSGTASLFDAGFMTSTLTQSIAVTNGSEYKVTFTVPTYINLTEIHTVQLAGGDIEYIYSSGSKSFDMTAGASGNIVFSSTTYGIHIGFVSIDNVSVREITYSSGENATNLLMTTGDGGAGGSGDGGDGGNLELTTGTGGTGATAGDYGNILLAKNGGKVGIGLGALSTPPQTLTVAGDANITGDANFASIEANDAYLTNLTILGDFNVATLQVSGISFTDGGINASGDSNFTNIGASGGTFLEGDLNVAGKATLRDLTVVGDSNFASLEANNAYLTNLTVTGDINAAQFSVSGVAFNNGGINATGETGASETDATDVLVATGGVGGAGTAESLGSNEVPSFASGWSGTDWYYAGIMSKSPGTGIDNLTETNPFTVKSGTKYRIDLSIVLMPTGGSVIITVGGDTSPLYTVSTPPTTIYLDTINTNSLVIIGDGGSGGSPILLTDLVVREVIPATNGANGSDIYLTLGAGGAGGAGTQLASGSIGSFGNLLLAKNGGNVGIGLGVSSSPTVALDINGSLQATGDSNFVNVGISGNIYGDSSTIVIADKYQSRTGIASGNGAVAFGTKISGPAGASIASSAAGTFTGGTINSAPAATDADILASQEGSFAFGFVDAPPGTTTRITSSGYGSVAMGYAVDGFVSATGNGAIALGRNVQALARGAVTLGDSLTNYNANSVLVDDLNVADDVMIYGDLDAAGTVSAAVKAFKIGHPLDEDKFLIHSAIEGPESAVYYRG